MSHLQDGINGDILRGEESAEHYPPVLAHDGLQYVVGLLPADADLGGHLQAGETKWETYA